MADNEKHPKSTVEEINHGDSSAVSTRARTLHLNGRYIKNRQNECRTQPTADEERTHAVILRLDDLPATSHNLQRIRELVRRLNRQLAASGTPVRLRVV